MYFTAGRVLNNAPSSSRRTRSWPTTRLPQVRRGRLFSADYIGGGVEGGDGDGTQPSPALFGEYPSAQPMTLQAALL